MPDLPKVKLAAPIEVIVGGLVTETLSTCVAGIPTPLVAVIVTVELPPAFGVPEMTPLEAFKLNPEGRVPAVTANVGAG